MKTIIPVAAGLLLLQGLAKFIRDLFFVITGRQL
jgi:TRAP-type mannitol/chloroaromatic compound transport system permease small subunit